MNRKDLIQALAVFTALERPSDAALAAAILPEFFDLVDILRAGDGAHQLARELDKLRRATAA